ncbi:DUF1592 domain-containing protein [Anatilimnocola floriformis]|uniref:DUF1592 domain-containing protein n=1 Tax=Anatilimnocola floriformis TaxID=2948575 RepID=UPI0020C548EA|nr:DUF1592 domain-containing protein [Anatilimnocola floriformis]
MFRFLPVIACLLLLSQALPTHAAPGDLPPEVKGFLKQHCLSCHATDVKEAKVDLQALSGEMSERSQAALWTRIYDQVNLGQMPPAGETRPAEKDRKAFLKSIESRLEIADRKLREVVQRRLNREEYQNTIRDLLAIEIDVKQLLPEDQQAGGFDNNGEALSISAELMGQYLKAAEAAIDAAIVHGPQPKTTTFTVDPAKEIKPLIPKQFGLVDGRSVLYTTDTGNYSKIATREKRVPVAGRYRFKFEAASHFSKQPVVFNARVSDFHGLAATNIDLGYYEVGAEPKVFELEATVGARSAIQFFALDLPRWLKDTSSGEFAGVEIGPVEITGPLFDTWPPKGHQQLLGDLDLAKGKLADAEPVLRRFIARAFRRPATDAEVQGYLALVQGRLEAGRSFETGLKSGFVAILCSPNFLYLREDVRSDSQRISDYELASRLSYFLVSTAPDAELLAAAERGTLHQPEVLRGQVERLLDDPRHERFINDFTGQWLKLRQIEATVPDPKVYTDFDDFLKWSMVEESRGFFRTLLTENLSIRNFLDSDFALLNRRLARHYGIEDVQGVQVHKVPLPKESVRGGVLTQAAVLKVTANGTNTSPVVRGVWVLENILGQAVPPPPPNISAIEPDIRGAVTIRDQLSKHRDNESCNTCHRHIDPPGFALESFDPTGKFREQYLRYHVEPQNRDKGWGKIVTAGKVDPSGQLSTGEKFADLRELKRLLVQQEDRFAHCLTVKLMTFALGREMGFSDRKPIAEIQQQAAAQGNGLRTLIHTIVASPAFSTP